VVARMPERSGGELVEGRTRLEGAPTSSGGSPILSKVKVTPLQPAGPRLTQHYENEALNTVQALWRRRWMICGFVIIGLALAVAAIVVVEKSYTSEAVIQLDFAARAGTIQGAPGANIDAAILVEGEARLIRSPTLTRRVVSRLKLDEDPAYISTGMLAKVLRIVSPGPSNSPGISMADLAAKKLEKQVKVTNDARAYLINIAITSTSPEWSAKLANAFALEYLQHRSLLQLQQAEAAARNALQDARGIFGEKHPTVIQARAQLDAAEGRIRAEEAKDYEEVTAPPGHSYLAAEPIWVPTAPNPVVMLGIGIVGSLLAGIGLALFLERRDTSLRTERSVAAETGIRCVGMIPKTADRTSSDRKHEQREAFRSLCLTVGLAGHRIEGPHVVMISSALPMKGKAAFVRGLANCVKEDGKRVLIVDLAEATVVGKAISLDDVVYNPALIREFIAEQKDQPISELRRKSGMGGSRSPLSSFARADWAFEQLLDEAKAHYDVLLIDTPPTLLFTDSIFLGRFADVSLHAVTWAKTPRATVVEAVRRLQEHMVRVDGVVLIDVDLGRYTAYEATDRTAYLSKYDKLFGSET
jgi:Mrp family chromosome partitioning ATPase